MSPRVAFSFLFWTPELTDAHLPLVDELAEMGYDGVELPIVTTPDAVLERFAARCDALGLGRTAVGFATPDANPIDPDPAGRARAIAHLGTLCEKAARLGA